MVEEDSNGYRHILKYTSVFGSVQGLNVIAGLVRNKFAALFWELPAWGWRHC